MIKSLFSIITIVQRHELRINDENLTWRIIYRIYTDMIMILEVFEKKTSKTPSRDIRRCYAEHSRWRRLSVLQADL